MRERRYSGRSRQDSWHEDGGAEEMPEWTMDDPFDGDIGTFDASGAFCSTKVRVQFLLCFQMLDFETSNSNFLSRNQIG